MKTKEMIEYVKKLYGYCLVFSHKMPLVDKKENEKAIGAIIKTLKDHDKLRKLYGMSDDRGN